MTTKLKFQIFKLSLFFFLFSFHLVNLLPRVTYVNYRNIIIITYLTVRRKKIYFFFEKRKSFQSKYRRLESCLIFNESPISLINLTYIFFCSWAVSTVMTRQNSIPHLGTVLIPFWDLCNHKNGYVSNFKFKRTDK